MAFPPPHIVLRLIAGGLGAKFPELDSSTRSVAELNQAEQFAMNTGNVIPFAGIPEYVRQHLKDKAKHG